MLREKLVVDGLVSEEELTQSPLATDTDILRAHAASYVRDIETGDIDPKAMRRIGFPWSPAIAKRACATAGGAIASARAALNQGIAGQLAGGTHHAHFDFGSGYCVYNDFAVAALNLLEEGIVRRVAIIDLDVHQGDGNASILGPRDDTFIFSMHGAKNFPFRKEKSDLDVEIPDDADDEYYLSALNSHIGAVFEFQPDVILYQAGVDPLAEDKLGRMALTHKGLYERDTVVWKLVRRTTHQSQWRLAAAMLIR